MKNVHYKKVAVCNQKKRSENHFSYLAVDGVWHLLILHFFLQSIYIQFVIKNNFLLMFLNIKIVKNVNWKVKNHKWSTCHQLIFFKFLFTAKLNYL